MNKNVGRSIAVDWNLEHLLSQIYGQSNSCGLNMSFSIFRDHMRGEEQWEEHKGDSE